MERAGFILTMAAGFFSVFLMGWQGYQGASADWVSGFLAVFWSLIMMLRLMTLTAPADVAAQNAGLAQKLIGNFRMQQEEDRQKILENAFGGSYLSFLLAGGVFVVWQVFCATFPAQQETLESLNLMMQDFFAGNGVQSPYIEGRIFDWGQEFLLFLSLALMGFVLRSHAAQQGMTRPMLLVLSSYAVAGYIAFAGLDPSMAAGVAVAQADIMGNGSGAASMLLGTIPEGRVLSLFDIILLESGIAGLAIITFILFIPLGYISLAAQNRQVDGMVVTCAMLSGAVMILSVFLPFTPALGGFMALCWMALFLAWGTAENNLSTSA